MDIDSKVNMSLDEIVKQRKRNNRKITTSNNKGGSRSIKSRLNTGSISKKSIPKGNINGNIFTRIFNRK